MPNAELFDVIVRAEARADEPGIRAVHCAAFGRQAEARLVDALRSSRAVIASIVAAAG